jgi:hypothetical protein
VKSRSGKNVIAVKCIDHGGEAGMVGEITLNNRTYRTNNDWKVTTDQEGNWQGVDFNDLSWRKATEIGPHGTTPPWSQYNNVEGIPEIEDVKWIWSSDNEGDNVVYFRLSIGVGGDVTPPAPPQNVVVTKR